VRAIGELERQRVPAGRQGDLRLCLALAEVEVPVVERHELAGWHRAPVDDQMMVPARMIEGVLTGRAQPRRSSSS